MSYQSRWDFYPHRDGVTLLSACEYFQEVVEYIEEKTLGGIPFVIYCYPDLGTLKIRISEMPKEFAEEVILPWVTTWRRENLQRDRYIGCSSAYLENILPRLEFRENVVSVVFPLTRHETNNVRRYRC